MRFLPDRLRVSHLAAVSECSGKKTLWSRLCFSKASCISYVRSVEMSVNCELVVWMRTNGNIDSCAGCFF